MYVDANKIIRKIFPIFVLVDRLNKEELGWLKALIKMKEARDKKSKRRRSK